MDKLYINDYKSLVDLDRFPVFTYHAIAWYAIINIILENILFITIYTYKFARLFDDSSKFSVISTILLAEKSLNMI